MNIKKKPHWWPALPYPEKVFPMNLDDEKRGYATLVPDGKDRAALSGALGREFWNIASETIHDSFARAWLELKYELETLGCDSAFIEQFENMMEPLPVE